MPIRMRTAAEPLRLKAPFRIPGCVVESFDLSVVTLEDGR